MAKALVVRINRLLDRQAAEGIREEILRQYHETGVIVFDNSIEYEVVELSATQVAGTGYLDLDRTELFAEKNGHKIYVVRDEYGRIVVSDELMRELIECYKAKEQT